MKQILVKQFFSVLTPALFILLSLILFPVKHAFAETNGQIQHIYDNAGLLSTAERNELEELCKKYSLANHAEFIVLTHNDSNAVDGEEYIENFYDKMVYGDSVIVLVDMFHRDVVIEAYGTLQTKVNGNTANAIAEKISPLLKEEKYAQALTQFVKSSDRYMNKIPFWQNSLIQLALAAVIGFTIVGIMAFNSGGRMTVGGNTYMDPNNSGLIGRRDDYIRTQITRVRKPQNNSGGGGGGISAGGHSHSTGRAKF